MNRRGFSHRSSPLPFHIKGFGRGGWEREGREREREREIEREREREREIG